MSVSLPVARSVQVKTLPDANPYAYIAVSYSPLTIVGRYLSDLRQQSTTLPDFGAITFLTSKTEVQVDRRSMTLRCFFLSVYDNRTSKIALTHSRDILVLVEKELALCQNSLHILTRLTYSRTNLDRCIFTFVRNITVNVGL